MASRSQQGLAGMAGTCPELLFLLEVGEPQRMSGWPSAGFKAMCHLGLTKGTLRMPLMSLEGLSS